MPAPTRGSDIEVTLKARNDAGATVAQFLGDMDRTRGAMREFGRSLQDLVPAATRGFAAISQFTGATKNFDIGTRAALIGVGLLTTAFVAYTRALDQAIDKAVQFGQVTRSWDLGRIRGEMESSRTELDRMVELRKRAPGGEEGAWYSPASWAAATLFAKDYYVEEWSKILFGTPRAEERVRQLQPQASTLIAVQQARARLELQGGMRQQEQARALALQQQQASFSSIGGYTAYGGMIETAAAAARDVEIAKAESDAKSALTARPEAAVEINKTLARQRALIHSTWETGTASRGIAARAFRQGIFEQTYTARMAASGEIEPGQGFEQVSAGMAASLPADLWAARYKGEAIRGATFAEAYAQGFQPGELEGGAEAVGVGASVDEQARGMRRYLSDLIEARDIERERGSIAASFIGFTRDEADLMARQRIELEKRVEIERAMKDERKIDLAEQRAAMDTLNLDITRGRRVDPITGLLYGVQQLEEELSSAGTRMQEVVRNTAAGMQRSFSDLFFDIVVGDFKKLPDIGRQFGQAMLRTLTDELAKSATLPLVQLVRQALGTGGGFAVPGLAGLTGGAAVLAPTVAGAAGGHQVVQTASGPMLVPTGGSGAGGGGIGMPSVPLNFLGGAGSYIRAVLNTPLSAIGQYGFGSAVSLTQAYGTASIAQIAAAESAATFGAGSGALSGGATLGGALGAAGAGVAAAFSIYSAYQSGDPIGGALSTGLSGLAFGGAVGGPIGAVVGLVAGAALGAGAGLLGKDGGGGKKPSPAERSRAQAASSGTAFENALSQVTNSEGLLNVLNKRWSPFRELPITAGRSDGSRIYPLEWIGDATGGGPRVRGAAVFGTLGGLFTFDDLFDPKVFETVEVQQGESGAASPNGRLTQLLKQKWQEVVANETGPTFDIEEFFRSQGMLIETGSLSAAVQRTSTYPVSRAKQFAGQPGITLDEVALRASGMTPAQIASLRQRLGLTGPTGGVVSDVESSFALVGPTGVVLSDNDLEQLMRGMARVNWERDLGFWTGGPATGEDDSTTGIAGHETGIGMTGLDTGQSGAVPGAPGQPGTSAGPPGDAPGGPPGGVGPGGGEW